MQISELLKKITTDLKEAGISTARLDGEIIVSDVLDIEKYRLITNHTDSVDEEKLTRIYEMVERRRHREPLAYIRGFKEFYSLDFDVNQSVLIPRPETEILVDLAIYHLKEKGTMLDMCTGSGAIAISVKYNRSDSIVTASDISEDALEVARKNAERILKDKEIKFIEGDLYENINEKYDIIVTNPPYVNPAKKGELEKELDYEPEMALYAEEEGKSVVGRIIKESSDYLNPDGMVLIEIGEQMNDYILDRAKENGFESSILKDYAGLPRVAVLKKN